MCTRWNTGIPEYVQELRGERDVCGMDGKDVCKLHMPVFTERCRTMQDLL